MGQEHRQRTAGKQGVSSLSSQIFSRPHDFPPQLPFPAEVRLRSPLSPFPSPGPRGGGGPYEGSAPSCLPECRCPDAASGSSDRGGYRQRRREQGQDPSRSPRAGCPCPGGSARSPCPLLGAGRVRSPADGQLSPLSLQQPPGAAPPQPKAALSPEQGRGKRGGGGACVEDEAAAGAAGLSRSRFKCASSDATPAVAGAAGTGVSFPCTFFALSY